MRQRKDIPDKTNGVCPSVRQRQDIPDKTNGVCPSMRQRKDIPDKTNGVCPSVRQRQDIPGDFPIVLVAVKPPAAREDCGVFGAGVEDFHPVQEPAGAEAAVVVLDVDLGQLAWREDGVGR